MWATLTDPPATITALLADPRTRTTPTTPQPASPAPTPDLAQGPMRSKLPMIMVSGGQAVPERVPDQLAAVA